MDKKSIEEMIKELEQYYEASGFKDVYEKELKGKSNSEIKEMHKRISKEEGDNESKIPF